MSLGVVRRGARWRALLLPFAAFVVLAAAVGATSALSAVSWKAPLNYATYVGAKGKANSKLAPIVLGWVNGQGGTVPGTSFPSTTRIMDASGEDDQRRARRRRRRPSPQAERVLHRLGRGGGHQVRSADGQRQEGEGDPVRRRRRREPVDLQRPQGLEAGRDRRLGEQRRREREERLLDDRHLDQRPLVVRPVREARLPERQDVRGRLPELAGLRRRGRRASRLRCSRSGSRRR